MILATYKDFEGEQPDSLYDPAYHEYDEFRERAEIIKQLVLPTAKPVVWGCGWGYLVKYLYDAGYDAVGVDASTYAINKAHELFPDITDRFIIRDITENHDIVGDFVVTDDLLPCLDDNEVEAALKRIRATHPRDIIHVITPNDDHFTPTFDLRLNWKPAIIWRRLLWPDKVLNTTTGKLVP